MANISFDNIINAFAHKSDRGLKRSRFIFRLIGYPLFVPIATRLTPLVMKSGLPVITRFIRKTIFKQFVGGETLQATAKVATVMSEFNVNVILDYAIEGKEGDDNFEEATQRIIEVIKYAATQPNVPFISIKVSSFADNELLRTLNDAPRLRSGIHDNEQEIAEWDKVCERMYRICEAAEENNVGVLVDAEQSWLQDPVDRLTIEMMEEFNTEKAIVYNTLQLYRQDRLHFLKLSHKIAVKNDFILGVKLVRGAYMEKERARAILTGHASPIHDTKEETDRDFDAAITYCIDNLENIAFILASHNEKSNMLAANLMEEKEIAPNHPHVCFSQLYGMSDNITFNLAKENYSVCKYLPFGPLKDVIPYLMRRAQENTSVKGQTGRELNLIRREIDRRKLKQNALQ